MNSPRRLLLFTGDGKGKTTAALGMVLRAVGHGMRICVIQFIKNDPETGERRALSQLPGVEFIQAGLGFVPSEGHENFPAHRRAALKALEMAEERLCRKTCDLIVLDEICAACAMKLIPVEEIIHLIENAPPTTIIVLTGRNAPPALIDIADTVTLMQCQKHGHQSGIQAEKGVEY